MFQDPFLNNGIGHSLGIFATNGTNYYPLSEIVLHNGNVLIATLGPFKGDH